MKLFVLSGCLFLLNICYSQNNDSINCSSVLRLQTNISIYIEGHQNEESIKRKFFRKKFELSLSDSSYEIVQFTITWGDFRKGNLYERLNHGKAVTSELTDSTITDKKNYSLEKINPGTYLGFNCIIIRKEGKFFRLPSFVIYVTY
jgi:hypothetical protein